MKKIVNDILKWVASLVTLEVIGMFFLDALISAMVTAFIPVKFLVVFFLIFSGYVYYKLRNNEKTKKLAKIIGMVILCFTIFFGTTATFPEVSRVLPWGLKKISIMAAKWIADPSKVKDMMVADAIKDSIVEAHSSDFEKAYKLNPEKAISDRDSIRNKYDFDKVKKRIEARNDSIANAKEQRRIHIQDSIANSKRTASEKLSQNSEDVIIIGAGLHTFPMNAGQTSKKIIVNGRYCANSDKGDRFGLYYPSLNKTVKAWLPGYLPEDNTFFLKSYRNQIVTIKVT